MAIDLDLKSAIARRSLAIDWAIRTLPPGSPFDGIKARTLEFEAFLSESQASATSAYVFGENINEAPQEFR